MTLRHIVIVGGGFAGAVSAIKLIGALHEPFALTVVEPAAQIGLGVAYSASDHDYTVNGPARLFVLHPDDPEHFLRWLEANKQSWSWRPPTGRGWGDGEPPRAVCGQYVVAELQRLRARAGDRVAWAHVRDRAVAVQESGDRATVVLASGERLEADQVVLATGLFRRAPPFVTPPTGDGAWRYIDDPWAADAFAGAETAKSVLLLGASLTMLDTITSLEKRGFKGVYHAVSRRGLVVRKRHDVTPWREFLDPASLPPTLRALLRSVQRERRALAAAGQDWQRIVPAIRPHLMALWANAAPAERRRFIRHLRTFWDVCLHRGPARAYANLERLRQERRFESFAAKVLGVDVDANGVSVTLRPRGAAQPERRRYDLVVNGLGHEFDWRRIDDPLVRQLLADGLVRPHDTGAGIDADPASRAVIGRDGAVSGVLFAVGHPLRGVSWESSSVSEQIVSATELARSLAALRTPRSAVA